jgi:hypothetical protein
MFKKREKRKEWAKRVKVVIIPARGGKSTICRELTDQWTAVDRSKMMYFLDVDIHVMNNCAHMVENLEISKIHKDQVAFTSIMRHIKNMMDTFPNIYIVVFTSNVHLANFLKVKDKADRILYFLPTAEFFESISLDLGHHLKDDLKEVRINRDQILKYHPKKNEYIYNDIKEIINILWRKLDLCRQI